MRLLTVMLPVLLWTGITYAGGIPSRRVDVTGVIVKMDPKADAIVLPERSVEVQQDTFVFVATGKTGHRGTFRDLMAGEKISIWFTRSGATKAIEIFRPGDGAHP